MPRNHLNRHPIIHKQAMSLGEKHHYSPGSGLRLKWGEIRTPTTTTTTPAPNKKVSFVFQMQSMNPTIRISLSVTKSVPEGMAL